ncbi:unnamed protein product [Mytilus edulis]|uniref:DZIP3-like HEPN domain-containing protein n=1 Tax=Mytilus edulis TaxID=6550 RepID=A0A8S3SUE3_MYTED|nr:unnamed protein product [Mytilus edulis]
MKQKSFTKDQWDIMFERGENINMDENVSEHCLSASKGITISRLDNTMNLLILSVVCPLFKSVNVVSECQSQISKIAVQQRKVTEREFADIWDKLEAHIDKISSHCKLSTCFMDECSIVKEAIFNRSQTRQNRQSILEDALNNHNFIKDTQFCNRARKELDVLILENNLNFAKAYCGKDIAVPLINGQYMKGAYPYSVMEQAENDLQVLISVSTNQRIGESREENTELKGKIKPHDLKEKGYNHNHLKIVQLITYIATLALVDVLKRRLPSANFGYFFNGMKSRLALLLDKREYQLLYPDNSKYNGDLRREYNQKVDVLFTSAIDPLMELELVCNAREKFEESKRDESKVIILKVTQIKLILLTKPHKEQTQETETPSSPMDTTLLYCRSVSDSAFTTTEETTTKANTTNLNSGDNIQPEPVTLSNPSLMDNKGYRSEKDEATVSNEKYNDVVEDAIFTKEHYFYLKDFIEKVEHLVIKEDIQERLKCPDSSSRIAGHISKPSRKCCNFAKSNVSPSDLEFSLLTTVLLNCCQDLFWKRCLEENNVTLEQFLNNNKHKIYHMWKTYISCPLCEDGKVPGPKSLSLTEYNWNCLFVSTTTPLYPSSFTAKRGIMVSQLDPDLAYTLMSTFCDVIEALELLREFRNKFAHPSDFQVNT